MRGLGLTHCYGTRTDASWKENVTRNLAAYCNPKYPSIYILDAQSGRELASYGPFEGFKAK
jgi:hypothetical protein